MLAQKKKSPVKRFSKYLKPVKNKIIAAIFCGVYKFLVPVAVAWVIGRLIGVLTNDLLTSDQKLRALGKYGAGIAAVIMLSPIIVYLRHTLAHNAAVIALNDLRLDLFAHVQKLSHSFFCKHHSGSLASRIVSDVNLCHQFVGQVLIQTWMHLAVIIGVLSYFFYMSWFLALLSISIIPIQVVIITTLGRKLKENSKQIQRQVSVLSGTTVESLSNQNVVKTFTAEKTEEERFSTISQSLLDFRITAGKLDALNQVILVLLSAIAPLMVVAVGGYYSILHPDKLPASLIVTFVLMQGQLYNPIANLANMQLVLAESVGAMERIFDLFDTSPEVTNSPNSIKAPSFKGKIEFKNVCFSYSPHKQTIKDVSLSINPLETAAFVGPSGGGKSTLAALIPRFYDIQSGSILIDGVDITSYKLRSLRAQIALVPQEPLLFSGTIYDNIAYGRPDATPEMVQEAARMAFADEFIYRLPNGMKCIIGERGAMLSGGQKQRIAIARAFLKNSPILILDEATSALDNESEKYIQEALEKLMKNRTTIVIAHRLSTIRNADKIFVFDDGKLIEEGSHESLLAEQKLYAGLVNLAR